MLLLTRKQSESLIIEVEGMAEPIEVALVETGAQAKLGISAPAKCKIWRKELYQTILANRQAATRAATSTRSLAKELASGLQSKPAAEKKPADADEPKSE
jgi:carbon storage regulator CsrA